MCSWGKISQGFECKTFFSRSILSSGWRKNITLRNPGINRTFCVWYKNDSAIFIVPKSDFRHKYLPNIHIYNYPLLEEQSAFISNIFAEPDSVVPEGLLCIGPKGAYLFVCCFLLETCPLTELYGHSLIWHLSNSMMLESFYFQKWTIVINTPCASLHPQFIWFANNSEMWSSI